MEYFKKSELMPQETFSGNTRSFLKEKALLKGTNSQKGQEQKVRHDKHSTSSKGTLEKPHQMYN